MIEAGGSHQGSGSQEHNEGSAHVFRVDSVHVNTDGERSLCVCLCKQTLKRGQQHSQGYRAQSSHRPRLMTGLCPSTNVNQLPSCFLNPNRRWYCSASSTITFRSRWLLVELCSWREQREKRSAISIPRPRANGSAGRNRQAETLSTYAQITTLTQWPQRMRGPRFSS